MNHLVFYNDYLLESVKSIYFIYDTYYKDIPREEFDIIIVSDPTTKPEPDNTGSYRTPTKLGVYCKWLLNLYVSNNLKIEDVYKATEYLRLYHRFKHTLPIKQRNIDNIKSLPDLAKIVEPFKEPIPELLSSTENKKAAFVKSFENYDLYIPQNYEQSRDLGRGTEWCTAADSDEGRKHFKRYDQWGKLYILISKTDHTEKYQLYFEEVQFMDRFDEKINLRSFLEKNTDLKDFLKPQIDKMLEYLNFKAFKRVRLDMYPNCTFFIKDGEVVLEYDGYSSFQVHYIICDIIDDYLDFEHTGINRRDYFLREKIEEAFDMKSSYKFYYKHPQATWQAVAAWLETRERGYRYLE